MHKNNVLTTDKVEYDIIYSTEHPTNQVPEHREKKPYSATMNVLRLLSSHKYWTIRQLSVCDASHTGGQCM
jgi:hypothetical protein